MGPDLLTPIPDGLLVSLDRAPNRYLRRPLKLLEQPRYMPPMVADAELPAQDGGDTTARPQFSSKAPCLRPLRKHIGNHLHLLLGQLGGPP
jgi:hypothetical protein